MTLCENCCSYNCEHYGTNSVNIGGCPTFTNKSFLKELVIAGQDKGEISWLYDLLIGDSTPLYLVMLKDGIFLNGVPILAFVTEEEANKHVRKLNERGTESQYTVVPIRATK